MDKIVVKLYKEDAKDMIAHGDRIDGSKYWLAVDPTNGEHKIHWVDGNAQWDPWPKGWLSIPLPALFPDGEGAEQEMAEDLLRDLGKREEIEQARDADISLPDWVEERYPTEWKERIADALDWEASAFIDACNGDGADLNRLAPWGDEVDEMGEYTGQIVQPPAEFEWA